MVTSLEDWIAEGTRVLWEGVPDEWQHWYPSPL
jgi:hypothetical protein